MRHPTGPGKIVGVMLNRSTTNPSFLSPISFLAASQNTVDIAVADINQDGELDVCVIDSALSIVLGD